MLFKDYLTKPGEHPLLVQGPAGPLEVMLTIPAEQKYKQIALLGHPHSLQGGSMNNKVVTTLSRACKDLGMLSLRFNFRGVGLSAGQYNEGIAEAEDLLFLLELCRQEQPACEFLLAGFSFGSYVTYRAAALAKIKHLISIAPAVHHYDYREFAYVPPNWSIIQGEADEVVPAQLVHDFALGFKPTLPVYPFAETGHFFHGKLLQLRDCLRQIIHAYFI